ncbi:hypothetical protein KEM54_006494 [Ascosphaera aggregata]|nr:hypothetical protein KEM54_006494 [Ascosphaera aggregata]
MKAQAAVLFAYLALPVLGLPVTNKCQFKPQSLKTAYVDAAERRGPPKSLAAGIIYGQPDTLDQIPDNYYREAGINYYRAGGAQMDAPNRGWIWNEYRGRFDSAKSNYLTARKHGGTFALLPHDVWGTDRLNETTVWPGDDGDWSDYDAFLDQLLSDLKKENMLENLQFDIWNEPDLTIFWNRTYDRWVSLWDRTYKRIRSDCDFNNVVITGPSLAGWPSPENPWWSAFMESVSKEGTIPDQWAWHMERDPADVDDDIAFTVPALQTMLANYSLPTNPKININEYGKPEEQVPAGASWWISRLERFNAIGMRGNWLSKLALHDYLANLLGKPKADEDDQFDHYGTTYWPVGEWRVYKYYHTNMTGERLGTQGSSDRALDVYSTIDEGSATIRVLAGVRLAQGEFKVQVNGLDKAICSSSNDVSVKTLRFDNNGKYGCVGEPKVVDTKKYTLKDGVLELSLNQKDNETAWAFEITN